MDEPNETTFDDFDEPVQELNERVDAVTSDEDEFGDSDEIPFDPD
jgi:hypothetical protein